jgi:hypothetical protein
MSTFIGNRWDEGTAETEFKRGKEMIDAKATWQSECAAGEWQYHPAEPDEGRELLLCRGSGILWVAVREGNKYVNVTNGAWLFVDEVWAWAYIQRPRKG